MIAEASMIVPFTGAGISTECGIPDFRSPGGLWSRNRPIPDDEFIASRDAPRQILAPPVCDGRDVHRLPLLAAAIGRWPRYYRAGKIPAIVTQNIDNLVIKVSGFADDHVRIRSCTATRPMRAASDAG